MEHWSKRLQTGIDGKGWSIAELSRRSGVSIDKIHKYRKGLVEQPRGDMLQRLASALEISALWIEHGIDEPHVRDDTANRHAFNLLRLSLTTMGEVERLGGRVDFILKDGSVGTAVALPGVGVRAFGVRIEDASMSPVLVAGDVVVVDPDAELTPGCCALALVGGKAIVRRARFTSASDPSKIALVPENPDFPTSQVGKKLPGKVIGRVVQMIKSA